ncbi:MAG: hypothetical protein IJD65_04325 [Mailhella sp.]|nr:hypothetical protein [Mailhella sp.]
MNTDSFEKVCNEIRARYIEAGHKDDVRFLTCSNRAFRDEVPVLILDKRPGKNTLGIAYDEYSCERGNAYFAERWSKNKAAGQTSLQLRMQAFYEDLRKFMGVDMTAETFAQEHVLTAYFNPFRDDCEEDETFLEGLWKSVLGCLNPNMIFALARSLFPCWRNISAPREGAGRSWERSKRYRRGSTTKCSCSRG